MLPNIAQQLDNLKRPEAVPAIAAGTSASNNKSKSGGDTENKDSSGDSQLIAKALASPAPPAVIQTNVAPLAAAAYFAEIYGQYVPQTFKTQLPYAKFLEYSAVKDKYMVAAPKQEEVPKQEESEAISAPAGSQSLLNLVV